MKVGMLASIEMRCGIARYSEDLAAGLKTLVDLEIVPTWEQSEPWESYLPQSIKRLNSCNVIHIQHDYSFWGSILPYRNRYFDHMEGLRPPKIITAHTLHTVRDMLRGGPAAKRILPYIPAYRRSIERDTFDIADRIIVHDQPASDVLTGRGISADKIRIIPMGVPAPDLDPELGNAFRRKYGFEGKRLGVIFGFVRPGREYETVLEVMPSLPDLTLVIAGGPRTPADEAYAQELGRLAGDRAVITGFLDDLEVAGVLNAADIILCPQEHGTGSYSLMVALGYGKPILASELPFFLDFECVLWTFRSGDSKDLADKLRILLDDEETRKRLSTKTLDYAREHSWDKTAEKTVEVYKELI